MWQLSQCWRCFQNSFSRYFCNRIHYTLRLVAEATRRTSGGNRRTHPPRITTGFRLPGSSATDERLELLLVAVHSLGVRHTLLLPNIPLTKNILQASITSDPIRTSIQSFLWLFALIVMVMFQRNFAIDILWKKYLFSKWCRRNKSEKRISRLELVWSKFWVSNLQSQSHSQSYLPFFLFLFQLGKCASQSRKSTGFR